MASFQCETSHVLADLPLVQDTYHKFCTGVASLQYGIFHVLVDAP